MEELQVHAREDDLAPFVRDPECDAMLAGGLDHA